MENTVEVIAKKIEEMPTQTIVKLIGEIAKKSKKKSLKSGSLFFKDFCKVIAGNLTKESTKDLITKYQLQ